MRKITKTLQRTWFVALGGQEAKIVVMEQDNKEFPIVIQCMALGYIGDFASLKDADKQMPALGAALFEAGYTKGTAKDYFRRKLK